MYVVSTGADFASMPTWFGTVFVHAGFIGMMTNLILGVLFARAQDSGDVLSWGEPTSLWVINIGLILFVGLKIAADIRLGAMMMGVGVLFALLISFLWLRASE